MRRTVVEASIVLVISLATGLVANSRRASGLPLDTDPRHLVMGTDVELVGIAEARRAYDEGAVMVDARANAVFARGHIDGAVPLSPENLDADYREWWEFIPTEGPVIVYASSAEGPIAAARARWLIQMGHKGAVVLFDGYEAWEAADLPTAAGEE